MFCHGSICFFLCLFLVVCCVVFRFFLPSFTSNNLDNFPAGWCVFPLFPCCVKSLCRIVSWSICTVCIWEMRGYPIAVTNASPWRKLFQRERSKTNTKIPKNVSNKYWVQKQTNKTMTTWCGTNETENSEENGTQPKYNLKENNIYTFLYRFFPAGFTEQTNLFWVIIFTGKYRLNIS